MSVAAEFRLPQRSHASTGVRSNAAAYFNRIYALMMHDIKNRFFGSGLGQIVMIFWPFAHIVLLLAIYTFTKRANPYGESILQYSAVSVYPFIIFSYSARWIVFSAIQNKTFLAYPIISSLDIMIARALLEVVSVTIVGIMLLITVSALGDSVLPVDLTGAICATLSTMFLATGMGFFNAPFAFIMPLWNIVITLLIICLWIASGVAFVANSLPEQIRTPLSYNPLLQCVEWFRVSYYNDYPTSLLDRWYVLECGLVMLTLGLILDKALRRFY